MDLDEFQRATNETAYYPGLGEEGVGGLIYCTIALNEEAGELAGKVKKMMRDENCVMSKERRIAIVREAGDVLWYLARIAEELGVPLSVVAAENIFKTQGRKERGTIGGSGDDR